MNKKVGIVATNHTGYVKALFSCMEAGNIAVPLRNEKDRYRIEAAEVTKVITPESDGAWMAPEFKTTASDQPALIGFTSGTTGNPKGILLSHNNLSDVITRLNKTMQLDSDVREYIGVPVYHSFGFGRCRAIAAAGGRFYIPALFRPAEIGEMLKKGTINAISTVPGLWRILLANNNLIGPYGSLVKWIEIGSQYMHRKEKEALKALFPNARIIQHYGLTEASRTTFLEIHDAEGDELESVGRAWDGPEVELTDDRKIAIRGLHVAQSTIANGEKMPITNDEGWLVTQDLGSIKNGYLYYEGRADDIINYGGIKISPEALENSIYNKLRHNGGLAISRKPGSARGDGFLVAFTPALNIKEQHLRQIVSQALLEWGVHASSSAITMAKVKSLPQTPSGKIQRHKLNELVNRKPKND